MNPEEWSRFKRYLSVDPSGCWSWTGARSRGYGIFATRPDGGKFKSRGAYRVSYEHFIGPVPPGLEIDHVCRNRACVNPFHLEAVTHAENQRRSKPYRRRNPNAAHGNGEMIREMRSRGLTLAEIGRQFGVSRQRIHQVLKSA